VRNQNRASEELRILRAETRDHVDAGGTPATAVPATLARPANAGEAVAVEAARQGEWMSSNGVERTELWTLTKGKRVASCSYSGHPLGFELRCDVDGEMRRTQVFRELEPMKLEAHAWFEAFGATAWR
jgi:hypothetical protein